MVNGMLGLLGVYVAVEKFRTLLDVARVVLGELVTGRLHRCQELLPLTTRANARAPTVLVVADGLILRLLLFFEVRNDRVSCSWCRFRC